MDAPSIPEIAKDPFAERQHYVDPRQTLRYKELLSAPLQFAVLNFEREMEPVPGGSDFSSAFKRKAATIGREQFSQSKRSKSKRSKGVHNSDDFANSPKGTVPKIPTRGTGLAGLDVMTRGSVDRDPRRLAQHRTVEQALDPKLEKRVVRSLVGNVQTARNTVDSISRFGCSVCQCELASAKRLELHVSGSTHNRNLETETIKVAICDGDSLVLKSQHMDQWPGRYCNVCNASFHDLSSFRVHLNGSMHLQKLYRYSSSF